MKRRASEGLSKGTARSGDPPDAQNDPKAQGIKEEEEEHSLGGQAVGDTSIESLTVDTASSSPGAGRAQQFTHDTGTVGVPSLSLNTRLQNQPIPVLPVGTPVEQTPAGPPPGIVDVNTVEWQYLDPQGHVQGRNACLLNGIFGVTFICHLGPFPSTTMQKWYDEGYFTASLLMRRINIDKNWVPVGDLLQLAESDSVQAGTAAQRGYLDRLAVGRDEEQK